jgi:hypothetical protein
MNKETIDEFVNNPEFVIVHTRSEEERCLIKKIIEILRPDYEGWKKGWKYSIRKMIKYNTIEIGLFNDFRTENKKWHAFYIIRCNSIGFCNIKEYCHGKFRNLNRTERKSVTPYVVELYDLLFNQSDYILK